MAPTATLAPFFLPMSLTLRSGCKVNLLLNILGKRSDGFHELETLLHPVGLYDELSFSLAHRGVQFTCSDPSLPLDQSNLVVKAANSFSARCGREGVRIHLHKRIPAAAGLGGGSGNASTTLLGLNELFGKPLTNAALVEIAAGLGSDVPFFLQSKPALGLGRGEQVTVLDPFSCLSAVWIVLVRPNFGVSTPWAYQELVRYPVALNGRPGRASELIATLRSGDLPRACGLLYNSLEAPVLAKYPLLEVFQEFFRKHHALVSLMSGSGSTTFALFDGEAAAQRAVNAIPAEFGDTNWIAAVPLVAS